MSLRIPGQGNRKRKKKTPSAVVRTPANTPATKQRVEISMPDGRTITRWITPRAAESKRSDIGMPYLNCDRVEYQSTVTGEMITSGVAHKEHLKRHDLVEVGNENMQELAAKNAAAREKEQNAERLKDIVETYDKLEQGQAPAQIEETNAVVESDGFERLDSASTDIVPPEPVHTTT